MSISYIVSRATIVRFYTFWFKRSLFSLINANDSYGDLTYVSSWYSYPDRLVELDFQHFPCCPVSFIPQRYR